MAESNVQEQPDERAPLLNGGYLSPTKPKITLHEAHFMPLRHQSNIYGLLSLCINNSNKLVVATLRGEVHCLEFHDPLIQRPPSFKTITFSYIPVGVEVVSIDAIKKEPNGIIIGIALIKTDTESNEAYFSVYGIHKDSYATFQWDDIADDWQPFTLKYTPFQITNTKILAGDHWEPVFLVSGDDCLVHVYRGLPAEVSQLSFQEESVHEFFPEFRELPSSVTYMDMKLIGSYRLTALGCQTGHTRCILVDLTSSAIVKTFSSDLVDGPITSVKLFTVSSNAKSSKNELDDYHLLVCSAVELGVVFWEVLRHGFGCPGVLPRSQLHDSVMCSAAADLDWDGRNELLLGTFGKQVLAYRLDEEGHNAELVWRRSFPHPIHGLWYGDLTGDGVCDMAVVSMGGVHILQHDLNQVSEVCMERAMRILNLEDEVPESEER